MRRLSKRIKLFPQKLTDAQRIRKHEILSWFDAVAYERIGILHGEYFLFQNGLGLLDKNGILIMIGAASDESFSRHFDDRMAAITAETKAGLIDHWDKIPLVHNAAIISDRYGGNYWHVTIDVIPRFRFYENYDIDLFIIPENHFQKKFQQDLYKKALGNKEIFTPSHVIKVRDPVLAFGRMSTEGIMWLRNTMNISVNSGKKRYYIRRGDSQSRRSVVDGSVSQGGLVEDADLMKLLEYFGFQTIDFGDGEYSIETQVKLLDEAHIILAAHGAHLTNIVYLNPPVTLIEIMGPEMYHACYLSIANVLDFNYYGITSDLLDEVGNIVVDCEKLYEIIEAALA